MATFKTLQAGRGLAAFAVVLRHAGSYIGEDPRFWRDPSIMAHLWASVLGVEYLFVLSGVVMLLAHWRDVGVPASLGTFAWRRFRRIYPLYWIVLAFVVPPYLLEHSFGKGYERDPWVLLSSVLLIHVHSIKTVLHAAWTLYEEIMFYFVFAVLIFNKRLGLCVIALWCACAVGVLVAFAAGVEMNLWLGVLCSPLHLLFGFGMAVTWTLKTYPTLNWLAFLVPGAALTGYVIFWTVQYGRPPVGIALTAGFAAALTIVGLVELERRGRIRPWPWLVFLGNASYAIYLVHYPFLSLSFRLSYRLSHAVHLSLWFWVLANAALATSFGVVAHLILERPLLRWLPRSFPRQTPPDAAPARLA